MATKHKVLILCPALVPLPSTCCSKSTVMYVTANTCTELSAPLLDSTKLQQSVAAQNLNATRPPHHKSGFSMNNGCTIQQQLLHNWWNVNQC